MLWRCRGQCVQSLWVFMRDSTAHNFEFRYLAWIARRDIWVRMGSTAKHGYQMLAVWTWQAFHEVAATLELMAQFLPGALMSREDLAWMDRRLKSNGRDTGNLFTALDAI